MQRSTRGYSCLELSMNFLPICNHLLHSFLSFSLSKVNFFQGTMIDTNLPEGSFNAIIDKALFDSLLCLPSGSTYILQYLAEVSCISLSSRFIIAIDSDQLIEKNYLR